MPVAALHNLGTQSQYMSHDRPSAPAGYYWHPVPEMKTSLLVPDGWSVRSAHDERVASYYFARGSLEVPTERRVALSVLAITQSSHEHDASEYAMEFLASVCQGRELVNIFDEQQMSLFIGNGCFARDEGTVLYMLMIANPKTDSLYQFLFSAPDAEWDGAWPVGEKMIGSVVLDPAL